MSQEFSEALNDCLDRLVQGEDIHECLRRYPNQAGELEPLLHVALATINAAEEVKPDQQARARNFLKFSEAARQRSAKPKRRVSWSPFRWLPVARPIAVGLASMLVFIMGAGVATAASSESVPGEPLYWVKTTKESVEGRLPRSDDGRANFEASLAQVRGKELSILIERGQFTRADIIRRRMSRHLERSAQYAGVTVTVSPAEMPFRAPALIGHKSSEHLVRRLVHDREIFRAKASLLLAELSPEDQRRAEQFFRRAELRYWMLLNALKSNSPESRPYLVFQVRHSGPGR